MSLDMNNAPKTKGKDFGIANAGVDMARCVSVVEIGEQPREFQGKPKPSAVQINFTFELPGQLLDIEQEDGTVIQKPRWVSINNVNFFTDEKARLVEIVKALDPNGETGGDLGALVDRPCFVTIEHKEWKGKPFAKVTAISGVPAGIEVPPLANDPRVFDWDDPDQKVWDTLPDWIQEKITSAENYVGSTVEAMIEGPNTPEEAEGKEKFDDDIPF